MRILLKNGTVYDGSKNAPVQEDVLLDGDKIAAIGSALDAQADRVIDCTGLCVAPGFIDAHSHNDFFYDYDNAEVYYSPFLRQGITTQITGNCGFSPFGVPSDCSHKENVGAGLFDAKAPGTFADFCSRAQGNLFVNMVPLVGQGSTRIGVKGLDATPLTKAEIDEEMNLVREALDGGAFGGSFGFMYEPGMYAKEDELVAFASTVAEYDGIVTVHPRACSKIALGYPLISKPHIELGLDEVIRLMEKSNVHMEYSHLIFAGRTSWPSIDPMLKKFYSYRAKGYDIAYDNYSMTYGASVITVICPAWYMALDEQQRKSPFNRFKLRLIVELTRKLLGISYNDFTIAYISDDCKQYEGRTVAEIAKAEGKDCLDKYLELIDASHGAGKIYLDGYYNEDLIRRLMQDELSVFMTDAWVEPRGVQNGAAYQCFPNFLVKANQYDIPLENIIHKMTGATAERFGIPQRGMLKEGNFADVTVFDNDGIRVDLARPDATPEGIRYVFVNGECAIDEAGYHTLRAGRVIKKPRK